MADNRVNTQFEGIFEAYSKEIFRHVSFKVADRYVAEDIVASTFLRYWEKHSSGEKIVNPRAFLYFIAHGLVIDYYRKSGRRATVSLDFVEDVFTVETDTESLDDKRRYEKVLEKLQSVKDEYQEVILLHYVEGLTIPEVASVLNESENNIRVRLHRALAKLRERFNHERH